MEESEQDKEIILKQIRTAESYNPKRGIQGEFTKSHMI